MENNSTPNSDFENYLRKNLNQIEASPEDDVWAKIAAKQAQPNRWLKFRKYGMYATGLVLFVVATLGIWQSQHHNAKDVNALQQAPRAAVLPADSMIQDNGVPIATTDNVDKSLVHPAKKNTIVPDFSPRVNSVPAASLRFRAENGLHYESPTTGTSVNIAANSLVDEHGQLVQGEAELFFREYRSVGDFLSSGIPMHYADGRGQYYFNSGGMFEVRVSQGGTPLKLDAGKTYDVAFTATHELENASLYYLDDQSKAWRFIPTAAFGQANLTEPPVVSETTVVTNNLRGQSTNCQPDPGELVEEPDDAELIKLGVQTGFELATGKLPMPMWFKKNPTLTDDQLLFRMERGLIQIKRHRDQGQLFFPEDLNRYFSELAAFKNCYFTYNVDSLSGSKRGRLLTNSDYWQRITVVSEGDAKCVITLYDGKEGQMQFHAVLTGSTENKTFNAEQVMAEYNRLRLQRQHDFAEKNKALRFFLHSSVAFKPKEEWCLYSYQWLEYFENNHAEMARRYAALVKEGLTTDDVKAAAAWKNWKKILREQLFSQTGGATVSVSAKNNLQYALKLSNFGIYNCDQIFRFGNDNPTFVTATYKTTTGQRIIPAMVSLMERRTRTFITQSATSQLIYSPGRKLDVIVTDGKGRQYHFPAEKYAAQKFEKNGVTVLTLTDVTEQTQSPKAWADWLDI